MKQAIKALPPAILFCRFGENYLVVLFDEK